MTSPIPALVAVGETYVANAIAAAIANLPPNYVKFEFSQQNTLTTFTGALGDPAAVPCLIRYVKATLGTSPGSGSVVIDILNNGVSIFTSSGHQPTIPAGTTADDGQPDITNMDTDDRLTVNVTSVGGGTAPKDLVITVWAIPLA